MDRPSADGSPTANAGEGVLAVLLWAWVAAVAAAYVWQFRALVGPILAVLGLA